MLLSFLIPGSHPDLSYNLALALICFGPSCLWSLRVVFTFKTEKFAPYSLQRESRLWMSLKNCDSFIKFLKFKNQGRKDYAPFIAGSRPKGYYYPRVFRAEIRRAPKELDSIRKELTHYFTKGNFTAPHV